MNISNIFLPQKNYFNFRAKYKNLDSNKTKSLTSDVVEISNKSVTLEQIEFTELELKVKDLVLQIDKLEEEARILKANLKAFYSAQDKYDYQELMQNKRNLQNKLNRFKKKHGFEGYELECTIREKIQYNNYARRIHNTKTLDGLAKLKERILTSFKVYAKNKSKLLELIEKCNLILIKNKKI